MFKPLDLEILRVSLTETLTETRRFMYKVVVGSIVCWQKEKIGNSLKVHPTVMTKTTLWTPMQTLKKMRDSISMWKYHTLY